MLPYLVLVLVLPFGGFATLGQKHTWDMVHDPVFENSQTHRDRG